MSLNRHFRALALDGAYPYEARPGRVPPFIALAPPTAEDAARVLRTNARRRHRVIERRAKGDEDALARDEPLLALVAAASLRARIATGADAGQRFRRLVDRMEPAGGPAGLDDRAAPIARYGEMSLHAASGDSARDRRRRERLCRQVGRPPGADDRLEERSDGRPALRLKTRWRDGTTPILMERRDLLDRIVPLIPPPAPTRCATTASWPRLRACANGSSRPTPRPPTPSPPQPTPDTRPSPARAPPLAPAPPATSSPGPPCTGSFDDEPFAFDQTSPFGET